MNEPEFHPGDQVIIEAPDGYPPWPSEPCEVVACIFFDPETEVAEYVVEFENGLFQRAHGATLISLDAKLAAMQRHAN